MTTAIRGLFHMVEWYLSSFLALTFVIFALIFFIVSITSKKKLKLPLAPGLIIFIFIASFSLFFPVNIHKYAGDTIRFIKAFFLSVYKTIAMFTGNGDFDGIIDATASLDGFIKDFYRVVFAIVFFTAPILTFGFILSFFKNVKAKMKYLLSFSKDIYVFSELNKKSIILAEDIKKNDRSGTIVFTNVQIDDDELSDRANTLKAIMFKSDVATLNFKHHRNNKKIQLFLFDKDEEMNLMEFEDVYKKIKNYPNASIYYLSSSAQGKLAISKNDDHKAKIYRINYNTYFIYRYLYEQGTDIFDTTIAEIDGKKVISIVIVGMGVCGKLLLKAYVWYAQMNGYYLKINGFDGGSMVLEQLEHECPELFDPKINGQLIEGDAQYDIKIHENCFAGTKKFDDEIAKIKDTSFVFVCLGNDEKSIAASLDLRKQYERMGIHPVINAVVDSNKEELFKDATIYSGERYDIRFVGDYKEIYSYKSVISSDLENDALNRHLRYGDEELFWKYEYNYRSSCATAIHARAKIHCGIKGVDEEDNKISDEDKDILNELEHRRWNAWMRSEGYIYSGSIDKKTRNNLGLLHNDIVPYDELPSVQKLKDLKVSSKKETK